MSNYKDPELTAWGGGESGTRRADHRHDASLQDLGQVGPGGHEGGQVGIAFTGVGGQMIGNGQGRKS